MQIRSISGKNVLVTAITGSSVDKYYPRGDNFWYSFSPDPNVAGLQSCLNAGNSGWYGSSFPAGLNPPPGYTQGQEADGAIYFTNGGNPPNPCDVSTPRQVGTWNNLIVQIRQFPNNKRALVTAVAGSANDKYYPRGDNFWDNFTKDPGADQYRACLNAGESGWYGLSFPGGISPPAGYQQGTTADGATFFSTNGQRQAAPETNVSAEDVTLVNVRPNPAQDQLTVTFMLDRSEAVSIRLLDMQGRVMQQQTAQGVAGKNERVLNVSALPTGLYMLDVRLGT